MNILFITRKYPPAIGGLEKFSYQLITEVSKTTNAEKITLSRSQKWLPLFFIYAFFKARKLCKTGKVDMIHLGDSVLSMLGVFLNKMYNVPVAVTCHGLDLTYKNKIYQKYLDIFFPKLNLYICVSKYTQELAKKRVPANKTVVVPNGVGSEFKYGRSKMELENVENEIGIPLKGKKILLTVGRLVERKGVLWFLQNVFKQLPQNYSYLIVGKGPEKKTISQCIKTNNLEARVKIISNADDEKVKEFYRVADIFIMPNIHVSNDAEGFGLVALEASATGLPVIASNLEGIKDAIIDGKNGYLAQERNSKMWKEKIEKISAKRGKEFSTYTLKRYSWNTVAGKYVKLFKRLHEI